ncbi:GbsR/MarR family transcriptional regulator [Chloroflexota bacterium]
MKQDMEQIKDGFIQGLARFSAFAGFNKIMGQIYGLLYLSREPVSLGQIAEQLQISKGNTSLNVRSMEQWGMIRRISKRGDRRDYYEAETDLWKMVRGILAARDEKEIEQMLRVIADGLSAADSLDAEYKTEEAAFFKERLQQMQRFGDTLTGIAKSFLALK